MSKKLFCLLMALLMLLTISCASAAEDLDNSTLETADGQEEVQSAIDDASLYIENNDTCDEVLSDPEDSDGVGDASFRIIPEVSIYGDVSVEAQVDATAGGYVTMTVAERSGAVIETKTLQLENTECLWVLDSDLPRGEYEVRAHYYGDLIFAPSDRTEYFTIDKDIADLDAETSVNNYGMIVVNASINKTATGNVTFRIAREGEDPDPAMDVTVAVVNGSASYDELTRFLKGNYTVYITYNGDDNYYMAYGEDSVKVNKSLIYPQTESVSVEHGFVDLVIDLGVPATGNVHVTYPSGSVGNVTIVDGKVSLYTPVDGEYGNVSLVFDYDGDENYYGFYQYYVDFFIKYDANLTARAYVDNYGAICAVATLNKSATGNITFIIVDYYDENIAECTVDINGSDDYYYEFNTYEEGYYAVQVIYNGDNLFDDSTAPYMGINVRNGYIHPFVEYLNVTGGEVNVTVDLNDPATGNVSVLYPSGYAENVTIVDGKVNIYHVFMDDEGNLTLVLSYAGDGTYYGFRDYVVDFFIRHDPDLKVDAKVNEYGIIEVVANVNRTATGTVSFKIRNSTGDVVGEGTEDIVNGSATFYELTLNNKGKYTIEVSYSGDDMFETASNGLAEVEVNKNYISPSVAYLNVTGGEVNVTVDLGVPATGNVSVVYPSGYVDNVTIADGKVNIYNVFMTEQGNLTFVLSYDGDENYYGFYEYFVDFIIKYDPDMKVEASVDQFGRILIHVNVNETATGEVTFRIRNAATNESVNLTVEVRNGTAVYEDDAIFAMGHYDIEVDYSGDEMFNDAQNGVNSVDITKESSVIQIESAKVNEYGAIVIRANITKFTEGNVTFMFRNVDTGKNITVPVAIGENGTIEYDELEPFENGAYTIMITYDGDASYYGTTEVTYLDVNKTYISPSVAYLNVTGGEVNVTVDLGVPVTGNVSVVYPSGYVENVTIAGGKVNIYNVFIDDEGNLTFVLSYDGDEDYYGFHGYSVDFFIKYDPDLYVEASVDQFGRILIYAEVNEAATGEVTFRIRNAATNETVNLTVEVEDGAAVYDKDTIFAMGHYDIEVDYSGDERFNDAQNGLNSVDVTKEIPAIEIESAKVSEYGAIVVKANITKGTAGNVTFIFLNTDTGKTVTVPVAIGENGTIEYNELDSFEKGFYTVLIHYYGDSSHYRAQDSTYVDVTKTAPSIDYTVKVAGGEVSIAVRMPSDISGNLTLVYPSGHVENFTIRNGSANIYTVFMKETGDMAVTVSFAGNDKYYAADAIIGFFIKQATLVKASSVSVVYKNNAKVTVKLTNLITDKAIAGANVEIVVNGKTYKGTTDKDGSAVITVPANMIPKKYTGKVVYRGTDTLERDLGEFSFAVKKATPKVTAKKKTFKKSVKVKKYAITLKDNKGKAIKKAKVTIKVGKKTFKAKTNAKGKAVFKLKKLTKKAKYTAKVTYKGNKYFNKVTKKVKITIK